MPSADSAVKIAQTLGVTVEYLVTGKLPQISEKPITPKIKKIINTIINFDDYDINSLEAITKAMKNRYQK